MSSWDREFTHSIEMLTLEILRQAIQALQPLTIPATLPPSIISTYDLTIDYRLLTPDDSFSVTNTPQPLSLNTETQQWERSGSTGRTRSRCLPGSDECKSFARFMDIIATVYVAIQRNKTIACTKRQIYYKDILLYADQLASDHALRGVAKWLGCTEMQLRVVSMRLWLQRWTVSLTNTPVCDINISVLHLGGFVLASFIGWRMASSTVPHPSEAFRMMSTLCNSFMEI